MSPLTTHVLDTSLGRPAQGVPVTLEIQEKGAWKKLAEGNTNSDGRIADLLPEGVLSKGVYQISFDTAAYFKANEQKGFYPYVKITFEVENPGQHYHVPLLLNPYGYSTYRGS